MRRTAVLGCLLLLLMGFDSFAADIYKYRDAQGVIHYTYDLGEVPEDQRQRIKTYKEEDASAIELPAGEEASQPSQDDSTNGQEEDAPPIIDEQKIEELNQKKKELDQEFANLMEEKYKLLKEKEKLGTLDGRDTAAVAEYDKKAKALNRKIADYQKRQKAFQKEAEDAEKALKKSQDSGA
jgi:hypothetical protein